MDELRNKLRIRTRLLSLVRRVWSPGPKPLILMYHRIADEPVDPWALSVSPAHFEEHLRVICRTRRAFHLTDFVKRHMKNTLPSNAVALTFDDGYLDNLTVGKPRLAGADVPATIFLATGYLDRPGEFWSDELARLVLLQSGPRSFDLTVRGGRKHFHFYRDSQRCEHCTQAATVYASREEMLTGLWQVLRRLEDQERQPIMVELRSIFSNCGYSPGRSRAMTRDEIRSLVAEGLVTIGAHTVTHPILPELDADTCSREIVQSKLDCEALNGAPVEGFAYPYGVLDAKTRASVRAAGFRFACATQRKPIAAKSDVFALPRINVRDCDGDAFEQMLRSE